jgi:carbamoyl-phosphate synthase small subunit
MISGSSGASGSRPGAGGWPNPALLVLEDGTVFGGEGFGASGTATGEVVFNTAMTGYQEVLTDPSYHRQLVAMTAPHIGNYGIAPQDDESAGVQVAGFIVRQASRIHSSHRAQGGLAELLLDSGVVGITEVDTRRLTRHIRAAGALRGVISSTESDVDALAERARRAPAMQGAELTSQVTTGAVYRLAADGESRFHVVAIDFGLKRNQLRLLQASGCDVTVVPAGTPAADIVALAPDGVFLSNGPGDPAAVRTGVATIAELLRARTPTFGICLGHQLLGLALGATTFKLPFGHHGVNQPIRNLATGVIEIASHNHGFAIDPDSLPSATAHGRVVETHVNLNDGTNAGLRALDVPAFSVQYHPESAPGPHDSRYLFAEFIELMAAHDGSGGRAASLRPPDPANPVSSPASRTAGGG